ncbi:PIN domain-containing protein [Candidatus Acetothermia bacterium]|nr:PIN domain-containing protein [Candidatus Acetothermia bacterium]
MPTVNVLVDSSVWIDHFRRDDPALRELLLQERVYTHSCVIGELACGNLAKRREVIDALLLLPCLAEARFEEALTFIERHRLWGKGLSWIDVQLLVACRIDGCLLWTRDRTLRSISKQLDVAYETN